MISIIPLLCIILAGCSSMSVFQSPGVLPKGKTETGIGADSLLSEYLNIRTVNLVTGPSIWRGGNILFNLFIH